MSVNLAVLIPACAATINLTSGIVHVSISRAPGWRVARATSAIVLSAALYCLSSIPYGVDGLSAGTYLAFARLTYAAAFLHAIAWLVYAYGGPDGMPSAMPRPVKWLAIGLAGIATIFTVTGLHLRPEVTTVDLAWAGVRYSYPETTMAGDAFGAIAPAVMLLVLARLSRRARDGERELRWHVAGCAVLLLCVVDEVLVANRVVAFLSLAEIGFVVVAVPLTVTLVRRVIADARRLAGVSHELEGEVRERTAERDRAQTALVQAEQLASLGRLAAGVGHEINNPLTYMQLALEDVRRYTSEADVPDGVREAVANAEDGARRIQKVVEGLRSYSKRQDRFERLDLRAVAGAALKVAWPRLRHVAGVDSEFGAVPDVLGDEAKLVQALVNLLTNAAQALTGRADARIVVRTVSRGDGWAAMSVVDNGAGIPAALLARVSEPYFTTRSKEGGLGLGLFVTRGIVDAHSGRLEFESAPGVGTIASIVLPSADRVERASEEEAAARADARGLEAAEGRGPSSANGDAAHRVGADAGEGVADAPGRAGRGVVAGPGGREAGGAATGVPGGRDVGGAAPGGPGGREAGAVATGAPGGRDAGGAAPGGPGASEAGSAAAGGPTGREVGGAETGGPDRRAAGGVPAELSAEGRVEPLFSLASSNGRVLLVDDEPLVISLLSRALGRTWEVATALSGREGLVLLDRGPFDAVICDLMMPGMSGMEFAEAVAKRDPQLRERMLFLTGGAIVPEAEAFLLRPDVRHLTKPVKIAELNAVLAGLSRRSI